MKHLFYIMSLVLMMLFSSIVTFAEDVVSQDKEVHTPWILVHTPINVVREYQKDGNSKIWYDSEQNQTTWFKVDH